MDSAPSSNADTAEQVSLQDNSTPSLLLRPQFAVASVAKVAEPNGGAGDDWYRYELASSLPDHGLSPWFARGGDGLRPKLRRGL